MSIDSTHGRKMFTLKWIKLLFVILQLGLVSNSFGYESYYRNQHFKMTSEAKDTFYGQIKPILDKRCVACHSCREAECRLKLISPEGLIRGGHTQQIHGTALMDVQRTQLFHDAVGEQAWRKKGFYSILTEPLRRNARGRAMPLRGWIT